jgi:hypothetical protein
MAGRTLPADTSIQAARVLTRQLQTMSDAERGEHLFEMIEDAREFTSAGVRHRHPQYTEQQVRHAIARLTWGRELYMKVFGHDIAP